MARRVDEGEGWHCDWSVGLPGNQGELDGFDVGRLASRVIRSLVDVPIEELLELDWLRCHWG